MLGIATLSLTIRWVRKPGASAIVSIIEVDYNIQSIDKTSKFNKDGMPAYIFRSKVALMTRPKEEKRRF